MSGTNEILPFANSGSANVLTQVAYNSDSQRPLGNQPGLARSNLVNKALRQASAMAAGLGLFIANRQANNITDSLTPAQVEEYLQDAIATHGPLPPTISGLSQSWWRRSADGYLEQGVSGILVPSAGGTISVFYPVPFVTTVLDVQVSVNPAATDQVGWSGAFLDHCVLETGVADAVGRLVNILVRGY